MKKKLLMLMSVLFSALFLNACGEDPQLVQFEKDMDVFCSRLSNIDTQINSIDAKSDNATKLLLDNLDELDRAFETLADMDFPEKFDYLETIADESSQFMSTAVENYHLAYNSGSYDEDKAFYAKANYERANKRLKIILSFLHGEKPEDVNYTYTNEEDGQSVTSQTSD